MDHEEVQEGEPISLKFSVKGEGNFANISTPELKVDSDKWKVYPPKGVFEGTDLFNYDGKKTFEYILIPQQESVDSTPEIKFNYFNPELGQYEEKSVRGVKIKVTAAPVNLSQPAGVPAVSQIKKERQPLWTSQKQLHFVPIKLRVGSSYDSLKPMFCKPWFYIVQLLPLVILVVLYRIGRERKRLREDVGYFKKVQEGEGVT